MSDLDAQIHDAAQRLAKGQLVAFPTETVYGLGADASNPEAVAAIFAAKGRPSNHPVIVHVAPQADLSYWVSDIPKEAQQLMDAFWPGPLTLILPRSEQALAAVSGGQDTIGIRCPSHPVAQAMLKAFEQIKGPGAGVAAPSANRFGQVSPTQAQHVRDEFPDVDSSELYVLSGGSSDVGIESTIVDVSRLAQGVAPVVLRPGHITATQIAEVLQRDLGHQQAENTPRVSGSLKAHYAPRTPLFLLSAEQISVLPAGNVVAVSFERLAPVGVHNYQAPPTPTHYASQLYAMLRSLDQQGYKAIYVQRPPQTPDWDAVNDRLGRAAAAFELDTDIT